MIQSKNNTQTYRYIRASRLCQRGHQEISYRRSRGLMPDSELYPAASVIFRIAGGIGRSDGKTLSRCHHRCQEYHRQQCLPYFELHLDRFAEPYTPRICSDAVCNWLVRLFQDYSWRTVMVAHDMRLVMVDDRQRSILRVCTPCQALKTWPPV